jgi:hypothetical protein
MRASKYLLESWGSPLPLWYWLPDRFQIEEHQIRIFWLMLAVKSDLTSSSEFLFGAAVVGLSVATHYSASGINAPIHNLTTFLWWFLFGDYISEQDLESSCLFGGLLPSNPEWELSTLLDETSSLRKIVGLLPRNLLDHPLVWNLANLSLRASHSKAICWYSAFSLNLELE